jgi:hypothetical protein
VGWLARQPHQGRFAAAARLYANAFADDARLAHDLRSGHRYHAACAAALAAAGQGEDAAKLDTKGRAGLRGQALGWLKADLALWAQAVKGTAAQRQQAGQQLGHWKEDRRLTGVRDREGLAKLPEGERLAWEQLWAEVEALRRRAHQDK